MKRLKILIYGAGAIGRGYMPWIFNPLVYDYYFVEADPSLRTLIQERKSYFSFRTVDGGYESMSVQVYGCFAPGEEFELIKSADVIVTAVGPRNFVTLRSVFENTHMPIICCENDSSIVNQMREWVGNSNLVFAIPDVITSNTAKKEMLDMDPLAVITEDGDFFVDDRVKTFINANCTFVDEYELNRQWMAKLYIHNAPHCIAAYLGSMIEVKFLHQAMSNAKIASIVQGAMDEMVVMLNKRTDIDNGFLTYYRNKELTRFKNILLFDPVSRVAREPFRKLAPKDRLIGSAQLCLAAGIVPNNILIGIMAAFCFQRADDPDSHIRFLHSSMNPSDFLNTIFKLRDSEALYILLVERWKSICATLEEIKK